MNNFSRRAAIPYFRLQMGWPSVLCGGWPRGGNEDVLRRAKLVPQVQSIFRRVASCERHEEDLRPPIQREESSIDGSGLLGGGVVEGVRHEWQVVAVVEVR